MHCTCCRPLSRRRAGRSDGCGDPGGPGILTPHREPAVQRAGANRSAQRSEAFSPPCDRQRGVARAEHGSLYRCPPFVAAASLDLMISPSPSVWASRSGWARSRNTASSASPWSSASWRPTPISSSAGTAWCPLAPTSACAGSPPCWRPCLPVAQRPRASCASAPRVRSTASGSMHGSCAPICAASGA